MATEVRLPQLGETMEEGTIVECKVKPGDEVKKGDVIFEIEVDKATLEMESPADGFVKRILVETGQTLLIGEPILILGDRDEEVPQSFVDSLKAGAAAVPTAEAPPAAEPRAVAKLAGKVKASSRAKKIAKDLGVDLAAVTGTGWAGRITENDVKKAATLTAAEPVLGATIPLNRLQKITAQKMLKSKQEIPCFYLSVRADVTDLVEFRTKFNQTSDIEVAYNDFIIRAVAIGLEKFPIMTGQLTGDKITLADGIGVGLAITVPGGMVAPIVKNVSKKDVAEIARDSKALIERARSNRLSPADLEGGCITVSNLGAFGIDSFIPIVVPGQCSILGIGRITDACVPENDSFAVRKLMSMTLSVDHKVTNGAYAAQFLDFVRKLLEDPSNFA
jgi:pyruvate dehydrogenase E2 component (dihydrolipoamide acetyltransferase)